MVNISGAYGGSDGEDGEIERILIKIFNIEKQNMEKNFYPDINRIFLFLLLNM